MIVGVHGIAQQYGGPNQLKPLWRRSLADGIEFAGGPEGLEVPLDIAFYGNLFRPRAGTPAKGGADPVDLEDLTDDEIAALSAAAGEVLTAAEIAAAADLPPSKGYLRVPPALQSVLRALDASFGRSAGVLYLGALRQVRRYLHDEGLKAAVDERVDGAVRAGCRIIVGHSLGSVVALEFVRRHPEHRLDLLLTLGSPLGLHMVQAGLPVSSFGSRTGRGIPDSVTTWVNVRDPRDPVACAGDLVRWWPGVDDRHVDNGGSAHDVARYLAAEETGSAVLEAAPALRHGTTG